MAKGVGRRSRAIGGGGTAIIAALDPEKTGFVRGDRVGQVTPGAAFRALGRAGIQIDRGTARAILQSYKANVTSKAGKIRLPDGSEVVGVRGSNLRPFVDRVASAARAPGVTASSRLVLDRKGGTKVPGIKVKSDGRTTDIPFVKLSGRRRRKGSN